VAIDGWGSLCVPCKAIAGLDRQRESGVRTKLNATKGPVHPREKGGGAFCTKRWVFAASLTMEARRAARRPFHSAETNLLNVDGRR
jgi:hypothetical protein